MEEKRVVRGGGVCKVNGRKDQEGKRTGVEWSGSGGGLSDSSSAENQPWGVWGGEALWIGGFGL